MFTGKYIATEMQRCHHITEIQICYTCTKKSKLLTVSLVWY